MKKRLLQLTCELRITADRRPIYEMTSRRDIKQKSAFLSLIFNITKNQDRTLWANSRSDTKFKEDVSV